MRLYGLLPVAVAARITRGKGEHIDTDKLRKVAKTGCETTMNALLEAADEIDRLRAELLSRPLHKAGRPLAGGLSVRSM